MRDRGGLERGAGAGLGGWAEGYDQTWVGIAVAGRSWAVQAGAALAPGLRGDGWL